MLQLHGQPVDLWLLCQRRWQPCGRSGRQPFHQKTFLEKKQNSWRFPWFKCETQFLMQDSRPSFFCRWLCDGFCFSDQIVNPHLIVKLTHHSWPLRYHSWCTQNMNFRRFFLGFLKESKPARIRPMLSL